MKQITAEDVRKLREETDRKTERLVKQILTYLIRKA